METNDKDINKRTLPNTDESIKDATDANMEADTRYHTDGMGGPGGTLKTGNLGAGDMLMSSTNVGGMDSRDEFFDDELNSAPEDTKE